MAPFAKGSGAPRGRRRIAGGRFEVRRAPYLATRAATRLNRAIRAFRVRLAVAGKLRKVGLIARMRKWLTHLDAIARDRRIARFNPPIARHETL
jgi:transposase